MKVITYQLFLKEPVLVTAPGGDPNADNSYSYIPGSALRGALVGRYFRQGGAAEDEAFSRLFLRGTVTFLNAYPAGPDGERTLPTPASWVMKKDDVQREIYDRAQGQEPDLPSRVKAAFIRVEGDIAVPPEVSFQVSIHTSRNREKGRAIDGDPGSAVYQYRALAAEEVLCGAIVVNSEEHESDDAALLKKLLEGGDLLLGGSQSAGYGLTAVKSVKQEDGWREVGGQAASIASGDDVTIYLASDAILRKPQSGRESNDVINALPQPLRSRVELAATPHTFTSMAWVGGFNTKWGLPLPQEWAVRKGSMWRLTATEDISAEEIRQMEARGVGERRAEGFGRLAFDPPWIGTARHLAESQARGEAESTPEGVTEPAAVGQGAAAMLAHMNRRLLEAELDRRVVVAAQKKTEDRPQGRLSNSQLARLRLRIRRQEEDFEDFKRYLQGTHERKSADDQFRKFRVAGRNFRSWLEKMANEPAQVWREILPQDESWQPPFVGDYQLNQDDRDLTHRYVARFIDAVCEQLAKKGDKNGRA